MEGVRAVVTTTVWRLIEAQRLEPELTLALDEVMLQSVVEGGSPTLRFWSWSARSVTIGSFQMVSDEVYLDRCLEDRVPVIRRISGGGCMFHAPDKELVYSLALPSSMVPRSIPASYAMLQAPIQQALVDLGVRATILENNIMIGSHKISGSSQRRVKGAVLHHGTLLLDVDEAEMFRYIKGDKVFPSGKGTCSTYRPVTSLKEHGALDMGKLEGVLTRRFLEGKEHEVTPWTNRELEKAKHLVLRKYLSNDWNLKL